MRSSCREDSFLVLMRVLNGECCVNSNFDASIFSTTKTRSIRPQLCPTLSRLVDHSSTQAGLRFCVPTLSRSPFPLRSTSSLAFTNPTFLLTTLLYTPTKHHARHTLPASPPPRRSAGRRHAAANDSVDESSATIPHLRRRTSQSGRRHRCRQQYEIVSQLCFLTFLCSD